MWNVDLNRLENALFTKKWSYQILSGEPITSIQLLIKAAPHIPAHEWHERIKQGGVHLNGAPLNLDIAVTPPALVEYFEPRNQLGDLHPETNPPLWSKEWIVFEDRDVIVINKPNKLPTLPVREQQNYNLRRYLEEYIGGAVHLPSRLDTSTTGLVVASKNPLTHKALQNSFEKRETIKRYRCEVSGKIFFEKISINSPIGRHPLHPILRATHSSGKDALTRFVLVQSRSTTTLVDAYPVTGRTHQIRVHANALGHPLVGDNFYNGHHSNRLHLCCIELTLPHPGSRESITFKIPPKSLPDWARE